MPLFSEDIILLEDNETLKKTDIKFIVIHNDIVYVNNKRYSGSYVELVAELQGFTVLR